MSFTLCVTPRTGETCVLLHFLLRQDSTVMELTARHLIDGAVWDDEEQAIAVLIEITDPASARPIDVRFDVVARGTAKPSARARFIGDVGTTRETADRVRHLSRSDRR